MAKSRRKRKKRSKNAGIIVIVGIGVVVAATITLAVVFWPFGGPEAPKTGVGTIIDRYRGPVIQGPPIFYTSNIQGRLTPGPCEESQYIGDLGGMGRLATLYTQWKSELRKEPLIVDVGNVTVGAHDDSEAVNDYAFKALDAVGVQYVNCGDNEAGMTLNALTDLAKGRSFKLLSANLVRADTREPVFESYAIAERDGLRVGLIGLIGDDIPPGRIGQGLRIENPADRLKAVVKALTDRADILVCLAYMPPAQIYKLASKFPEVGLFLGGRASCTSAPFELSSPSATPRRSLIAYLGDEGRSAGRIAPIFPTELGQGDPAAQATVTLLTKEIEEATELKSLLADFTKIVSDGDPKNLPGGDWDDKMPSSSMFVGSEVCRICHIKTFYAWQKTKHAGAWVTLLQQDPAQHKNPDCLTCHATGFHMPGGFDPDKVADNPETTLQDQPSIPREDDIDTQDRDNEAENKRTKLAMKTRIARKSQQALKGVGCEACHGGARRHLGIALKIRSFVVKDSQLRTKPATTSCIRCHSAKRPCLDDEKSDPFYLPEYLETIKHWD
ncbi:hypothetical protein HQ560_02465 [bacterium]|nr:hypothetical protein [bacterium]